MTAGVPQTATIVFTDLVDSTRIRSSLGEEAADTLGELHFGMLRQATEQAQGRVVKSLGDGVLAVFDAAADAIDAAVAMQQATDEYSRRPDALAPLSIRVGISTGDVSFGRDGDVAGTAVVEAARLEASATGGQILCAELTKFVSRGRGGHVFVEVGALELKGLAEPVATCEVLWERLAVSAAHILPPPLATRPDVFVGRRDIVDAAVAAVGGAAPSRLFVLKGEPGIGKTTIATVVAQAVHDQGTPVLFGRCDRQLNLPYRPFAEAVEGWARQVGPAVVAETLDDSHAALGWISGSVSEALGAPRRASRPEAERVALFGAMHAFLERVRPLVVIDDLQWATHETVLLLRHLVTSLAHGGVPFLATIRDAEPNDSVRVCLDDAAALGLAEVAMVGGLDANACAEVVGAGDGAALQRQTGGNPLFLHALAGEPDPSAARDSVERAVARRVQGLAEPLRITLRAAAVMGTRFIPSMLATVLDQSEPDVLQALDEATAAGLVREEGIDRFAFSHGLVQESFYNEIGVTRRARLHGQIGACIEAVFPDRAALLAHHFDAADDTAKAIRYLTIAAERAEELASHEDAEALHTRLAELHQDEATQLRHRHAALLARVHSGEWTRSRQREFMDITKRASELGETELMVRAGLDASFFVVVLGMEALPTDLEETFDLDTITEPELRIRAVAALAMELTIGKGRFADARAALDLIEPLVDASDNPLAAAWYHHSSMWSLNRAGDLADRIAHGKEAVRLLGMAGDLVQASGTGWMLAACHLQAGDTHAAERMLETSLRVVEQRPTVLHRQLLRALAVTLMHTRGRLAEALESLERYHDLVSEEFETFDNEGVYGIQKFVILRDLGQLATIAPQIEMIARMDPEAAGAWRPGLAAIYAELGMGERAREELRQILRTHLGPDDNRHALTLAFCSEAAVAGGDVDGARELTERLEPYAGQHLCLPGLAYLGPAELALGRLATTCGDLDRAADTLQESLRMASAAEAPGFVARSALALAELSSTLDHHADQRRYAQLARTTAEDLGMAVVAAKARELAT